MAVPRPRRPAAFIVTSAISALALTFVATPAGAVKPAGHAPVATLTSEQQLGPIYAQGIARVPDGWIVSGIDVLAHLDDQLQQIKVVLPAIPAMWKAKGYVHIGDIDVVGNIIYAPYEEPDYTKGKQATARYDARTLAFIDAVELRQHENSFVTMDAKTKVAYSMDHFDGHALLRYDVAHKWKRLRPLKMSTTVHRVQGADVAAGAAWLSTDDPTHSIYRVDLRSGRVDRVGSSGHAGGEGEGIDATKTSQGLLHVQTVDQKIVPVWLDHFTVTKAPNR